MNEFLFAFNDEQPAPTSEIVELASDVQLSQIRNALERAGINNQQKRKLLVEAAIGRQVASLRELKSIEVRAVIYRVNDQLASLKPESGKSDWDDREEDTWIDKL